MSHARIETSVPRHPKFLRAGPAASWLWLAGVCYCQEALTDGFISTEALTTLGVPRPRPLAAILVRVGLWDVRDGGWQIHDYLDHNNSAAYVRHIKAERHAAGQRGGRAGPATGPKQLASRLLQQPAQQPGKPTVRTTVPVRTERTAALPQRTAAATVVQHAPYAVITAVVAKEILPLRVEDHQLMPVTVARLDQLRIPYDAETVRKAIDSALFRYYRSVRFRLEAALGHPLPDPRGIFHDHERPRLTPGIRRAG